MTTFLRWLSALQVRRAGRVLGVVAIVTALATTLAARLTLQTGFESLLPDGRDSVQELHRVAARTGGASTLFVVLEGDDVPSLRRAGDAIVPALREIGAPWVTHAEDDVRAAQAFLAPRAGLFAKRDALEALQRDVEARFEYEVGEQTGTNLELDPEDVPPPVDAALVKKHLGDVEVDDGRFPDGYYQCAANAARPCVVVVVRSGILPSDFERGPEAIARVRAAVDALRADGLVDASIQASITGDLAIGIAEYEAIRADLRDVGVVGLLLLAGVVFLYYLRLRTLLALALTIGVGLAWTFAFTELALGHLNLATGFLFTIVAGNGINFAILFMARYLEERRRGLDHAGAIRSAHEETWRPTLTAALAAGVAYGSLGVSSFRGFREFGIIGGAGMALTWVATYLALPAVLTILERVRPVDVAAPRLEGTGLRARIARLAREGVPFGRPFAAIVERAPRAVAIVGVGLAVAGAVAAARYAEGDPLEYDLAKVQSDPRVNSEQQRLIQVAKRVTGFIGLDGMAVLVDDVGQVAPLRAALEARRDAAPRGLEPFKAVHALQDFVPDDQPEKLEVLRALKSRLLTARRRHLVTDEDWAKIERVVPPDDLTPFGIADLPEAIARQFTERDGTRGRVVYISPTSDDLVSDAHYLLRWADAFRRTELPDGSVILGSGRAVIYADMWAAVLADIPAAVSLSLGATFLVVLVAFRGRRAALSVIFGLVVGVAWTAGLLTLVHAKLNFLNFIALPITFGIGVDYAVNVAHRDGRTGDVLDAVRRTGGAVVLCSMTTLLGYLALVRSMNQAVRSLGVAAVLGEIACLLAAVLVLPAVLVWWRRARVAAKEADASGQTGTWNRSAT